MTLSDQAPHVLGEEIWEYEPPLPRGIVVAVDESPESIEALRMASGISLRRGWRLHVISVVPAAPGRNIVPDITGDLRQKEMDRIELRASAIKEILAQNRGAAQPTYEVTVGDVTTSIVSAAECRGAGLIVSGRTHHSSFDRLMGNETTLHMMRASHIPVLAVCTAAHDLKQVVVATDFSDSSVKAAELAAELMAGTGTIHLVYVDVPREVVAGVPVRHDDPVATDIVTWFRRMSSSLAGSSKLRVEPTVLTGDPVDAVLEFSERIGADMIAVGSHGYSRVERLFLGSVSTALVRRSPLPILVTPGASSMRHNRSL